MKRCIILSLGLIVAGGLLVDEGRAWRGGGGGGRGGGGGGFRGGAPPGGVSGGGRPAPAARPAGGGAAVANRGTSFSSPGGGAAAGRAAAQPGTRPGVVAGAGAATGVRPGAGVAARPAIAAGATAGARPGTLPGLVTGGRAQNLPQTREARVASLQDRMTSGERQGQRQEERGERQQGRQEYRGQAREDWQNWAGEHGDWYHGAWSGGWYPGATFANYPVAAALGVTWWGVSRLSYGFGMGGYGNPYAGDGGAGGYDYSQPIASYQPAAEAQPASTTDTTATTAPSGVSQEGMALFDQSRSAFSKGDYKQALDLCNQTLKTMPNDAVVHEFRSLVLFALQNYRESAAAAYAVLSAGPGWDWTTLSSLYGSVADYNTQLRALESFVQQNPKSSDGHFLLAYHYLTAGHADAAHSQLREVDRLTPNDRLVRRLLGLSSAPDQDTTKPTPPPPQKADKALQAEQLVGVWTTAASGGSKFQMTLDKDSTYSWKFTSGKKSDEIKGIFAVEQNNLALQVDDGSVLLAEVALEGNRLRFKVIGGESNDPGLTFTR